MISGFFVRLLTWLGSRGIRIIVREIADALEEAEIERDYQAALIEKERLDAQNADQAEALRIERAARDTPRGLPAGETRRGRRPS